MQDVAAARVADQDRLPHLELVDDFEDIVGATLRAVAGRRVIGRADAAPGDGVDVEPIGQLRRDVVVDMGRQVAADEDQRPPRPAPVEDFEADGSIDGDEPDLMRRRIAPLGLLLGISGVCGKGSGQREDDGEAEGNEHGVSARVRGQSLVTVPDG